MIPSKIQLMAIRAWFCGPVLALFIIGSVIIVRLELAAWLTLIGVILVSSLAAATIWAYLQFEKSVQIRKVSVASALSAVLVAILVFGIKLSADWQAKQRNLGQSAAVCAILTAWGMPLLLFLKPNRPSETSPSPKDEPLA